MTVAGSSEEHTCVNCGRKTYENVGKLINGGWWCFNCAHGNWPRREALSSKERLCGACGRIIPVGGSRDCGLDHALLEHCAKHGSHAPGECPRCDALAEARSIVATTYIPPAPPSSDERAAVTPEDTDVGRYARNYFRRQAKAPLVRESPHCPTCGCGLAPETNSRQLIESSFTVYESDPVARLVHYRAMIDMLISRAAPKAFVQLCAPHGQDWLTCPECAKAAMGPQA